VLKAIVGDRDWSHWKDYASPAFFALLPASEVARQVGDLARCYWQNSVARQRRDGLASLIAGAGTPLALAPQPPPTRPHREEHASVVVELFFLQLLADDVAFLDLDASGFGVNAEVLVGSPRPAWVHWDEPFLVAVRDLYGGFYGEDSTRYLGGLAALGLRPAQHVFEAQFGGSRRGSLRFSLEDFRRGFHDTFVACSHAQSRLHRNFLALGIYLGSLYEHLEAMGVAVDVSAAFRRAADGAARVGRGSR